MKRFKQYIQSQFVTEARGILSGKGLSKDDHLNRYINPFLGSKTSTHELAKDFQDLPKGTKLRFHHTIDYDGQTHIVASPENSRKKYTIPASRIHKPGEAKENKGFKYEQDFVNRLKKHGLMRSDVAAAGFGSGNDFHLEDKNRNILHKGEVHSDNQIESDKPGVLQGETKANKTAAFGQATIHWDPEKGGWHIPEETRKKRPKYCREIDKSGIVDEMNRKHPYKPLKYGEKAKELKQDHPNVTPANRYLQDHHVSVLQVGNHGTYKVGKNDETNHGLPEFKGHGYFRVRQKTANPMHRTISFHVKHAVKSHVDLDNDDHLAEMAKTLGHKSVAFNTREE